MPWRIAELTELLTVEFKLWRSSAPGSAERAYIENNIIYVAGILGHYVVDSANPHHATIHYNGWVGMTNPNRFANDCGTHSRFESQFISHAVELSDVKPKLAAPLLRTDYFNTALELIRASNALVEKLYTLDRDGAFDPLRRPASPEGIAFASDRIANGSSILRDLWWSAWINSAAKPAQERVTLQRFHGTSSTPAACREARRHEEVVRQAVQVRDRRDGGRRCRRPARPRSRSARRQTVRATCRCAAVERAAGQDERGQRRELALHGVDGRSSCFDARRVDAGKAARARRREMRADLEEIDLHLMQDRVDVRRDGVVRATPRKRAQLVDGPVGLDARVVLRDARSAEERGLAVVAGAGVDLHASASSCRIRSFTTISARSGITSQAMLRTTWSDISSTTRRAMRSTCSSVSSRARSRIDGVGDERGGAAGRGPRRRPRGSGSA